MLKSLYWRIHFYLKNRKSIRINKRLGNSVKAIIVESENGILAIDPRDLEVGLKLRKEGGYGIKEINRITQLITSKSNVLIVGAHIGSLAIPISQKCSKLVAIEANPNNFQLLKTNIDLNQINNIEAHNIAASSKKEKIKFQMNTVNSGGSKRLPINNNYMYRYDNPEVIEVQAYSLDKYLPELNFDLILIDIEGSEYFAIQGMKEILSNCNKLIIEFLPHHLQNVANVSVAKLLSLIPTQLNKITIPSKGKTYPRDIGESILHKMYNDNQGDDGVIFYN